MFDVGGDGGHELQGAGTAADHRDPLAGQVGAVDPLRGVHGESGERIATLDIGELRPVELAHRADERRRRQVLGVTLVATCGAHLDGPAGRGLVPRRTHDLGREPHPIGDAVLVEAPLEVRLQLGLLGEELGPGVVGCERVRVEVVADVDAAPGIAVLEPGATDPGVLLDDRELDAGLGETDAGEQARHTGPDHDHSETAGRTTADVDVFGLDAGIDTVELELLQQHRQVLVGHRLDDEEVHHLLDELGPGRRRQHTAAVAELDECGERLGSHRRLVGRVDEPLHLVDEQSDRFDRPADPRRITGDVHHRRHEGRDAEVLEVGGDGCVVVGERGAGKPALDTHDTPLTRPLAVLAGQCSWIPPDRPVFRRTIAPRRPTQF